MAVRCRFERAVHLPSFLSVFLLPMHKRLFFLAFAVLLFAPTALAQWSDAQLQESYLAFLSDEGVEGWVDSDGDVQFEYNERNYFIETNDGDNEFFRVVLFNIWPIESEQERIQVLAAVNEVNREMKVVKGYTLNDNVWIACELFLGSPEGFKPVWQRCMNAIDSAVDTFVAEM